MRVRVLGSGSSGGVPLVGCGCPVCTSGHPRNRRTRPSISLAAERDGRVIRVLVDTAPDLRHQLLAAGETRFDAVLFTHYHADHLHGLDDLRSVNYHNGGPLDCWAEAYTMMRIRERFAYAFAPPSSQGGTYRPLLTPRTIDGPFDVGTLAVTPFAQGHGGSRHPTLGLRFGAFAYSTDARFLDDAAFAALEGVSVWIVDCLRRLPNPAHSHLAQTLEWIARVKPRLAILTHMNHEMDYVALCDELPDGVVPAYDGMVIDIDTARVVETRPS